MPTFMCFLNWTDQGARGVKTRRSDTRPARPSSLNWVVTLRFVSLQYITCAEFRLGGWLRPQHASLLPVACLW
jgi:uncharacterized protein with GYD domain